MKRILPGLIAAAALFLLLTPSEARAQYYRPGFRVSVYGGGYPYPYYRPYYYPPPVYYPPRPVYYYPPPPPVVYGPPVIAPGFSFTIRGR